jgi:hypothetical protein
MGTGVRHFGASQIHNELLDFLQPQPVARLDSGLAGRLGDCLFPPPLRAAPRAGRAELDPRAFQPIERPRR